MENLHRAEAEKETSGEAEEETKTPETQGELKESSSEPSANSEEKQQGNKSEPDHSVDEVDDREKASSSPKISPLPRDHPSHKEDQEEIAKKAETLRDLTKVRKNN